MNIPYTVAICFSPNVYVHNHSHHHAVSGLSLIFEIGGDIQKIAGDLSYCSEVNKLVL